MSGNASRSMSAPELKELRGSKRMSPSLSMIMSEHLHSTGSVHTHGLGIELRIGKIWGRCSKSLEFASSTSSSSSTPALAFTSLGMGAHVGTGSSKVDSKVNMGQDTRL